MQILKGRRNKIVGAALGLGLALAATAGYAVADAGTDSNRAEAPYSQVALEADTAGKIALQNNVDQVTNPSNGRYCVKVDKEANVEVDKTIPFVQAPGRGRVTVNNKPTATCGNAADTYTIGTWDDAWNLSSRGFRLLVP